MPEQILPFGQLDEFGLNFDQPNVSLGPNVFSNGRNIRFKDGAVRKFLGHIEIFEQALINSGFNVTPNFQHVEYWANPNQHYYVVVNSETQGDNIRDIVYLITANATTGDPEAINVSPTDAEGVNGFDSNGTWNSTQFNGGYSVIINNGRDIPHHLTVQQNIEIVVGETFFEPLPGWDSYNIDNEVFNQTFDVETTSVDVIPQLDPADVLVARNAETNAVINGSTANMDVITNVQRLYGQTVSETTTTLDLPLLTTEQQTNLLVEVNDAPLTLNTGYTLSDVTIAGPNQTLGSVAAPAQEVATTYTFIISRLTDDMGSPITFDTPITDALIADIRVFLGVDDDAQPVPFAITVGNFENTVTRGRDTTTITLTAPASSEDENFLIQRTTETTQTRITFTPAITAGQTIVITQRANIPVTRFTFSTAVAAGTEVSIFHDVENPSVRAGIITAVGQVLVAGDLSEVNPARANAIVRSLPGVVRSSSVALTGSIPNNWNPFAVGAGTADELILADTGRIAAMRQLQGNLFVYTQDSIHRVTISDQGLSSIPITTQYGALAQRAVFEFDGRHIVVGSNDIYSFEGHPASIKSIADGVIRNYFFDNLDPINTGRVFIIRNQGFNELWIGFPNRNATEGLGNEALVWNYKTQAWSIRDLPDVTNATTGPIPGGGIPRATTTITGTSGNNVALNTGRQEVQTLTVTGGVRAPHSGITQTQEITVPEFTAFDTPVARSIDLVVIGDSGPNITFAENTIGINAGATIADNALYEGLLITLQVDSPAATFNIPATVLTLAAGSRTSAEIATALNNYINSGNLAGFTWSSAVSGSTLTLTSTEPGPRTFTAGTMTQYLPASDVGLGPIAITNGSSDAQDVMVRRADSNIPVAAFSGTTSGTGGISAAVTAGIPATLALTNVGFNTARGYYTYTWNAPAGGATIDITLNARQNSGSVNPGVLSTQSDLFTITRTVNTGREENGRTDLDVDTITFDRVLRAGSDGGLDVTYRFQATVPAGAGLVAIGATLRQDFNPPVTLVSNNSTVDTFDISFTNGNDYAVPLNGSSTGGARTINSGATVQVQDNGTSNGFTIAADAFNRPASVWTVTNNRTDGIYPLQTELRGFVLTVDGSPYNLGTISSGASVMTPNVIGRTTSASWTASITGILTEDTPSTTVNGNVNSVGGSTVNIERETTLNVPAFDTTNTSPTAGITATVTPQAPTFQEATLTGSGQSVSAVNIPAGDVDFTISATPRTDDNLNLLFSTDSYDASGLTITTNAPVPFRVGGGTPTQPGAAGSSGWFDFNFSERGVGNTFTVRVTGTVATARTWDGFQGNAGGAPASSNGNITLTNNPAPPVAIASGNNDLSTSASERSFGSTSAVAGNTFSGGVDSSVRSDAWYVRFSVSSSPADYSVDSVTIRNERSGETAGISVGSNGTYFQGPVWLNNDGSTPTNVVGNLIPNLSAFPGGIQAGDTFTISAASGFRQGLATVSSGQRTRSITTRAFYRITFTNTNSFPVVLNSNSTGGARTLAAGVTDLADSNVESTSYRIAGPTIQRHDFYATRQANTAPASITAITQDGGTVPVILPFSVPTTRTRIVEGEHDGSIAVTVQYTTAGTVGGSSVITPDPSRTSTVTGNGIVGISEEASPAIRATLVHSGGSGDFTSVLPDFPKNLTVSTEFRDFIRDTLLGNSADYPQFQGVDPDTGPSVVQPAGAEYYVELSEFGVRFVDVANAGGTLSVIFDTFTGTTARGGTTFGGNVSGFIDVTAADSGGGAFPEFNINHRGGIIAMGFDTGRITNVSYAQAIASLINDLGTYTATNNGNIVTVEDLRLDGVNNLISVEATSNTNVPDTITGVQTRMGFVPNPTPATICLTIPQATDIYGRETQASQMLVAQLNGPLDSILTSDDIAAIIRAKNIDGWTLSGTGSDIIFTTNDNVNINRVDSGLGTGTVRNVRWGYSNPVIADDLREEVPLVISSAAGVETTSGIPVRSTTPTVIRIRYSDQTIQDFVFGGSNNGALPAGTTYDFDIYRLGTGSTRYGNQQINDELARAIRLLGGDRIRVSQNVSTGTLEITPTQSNEVAFFISSIEFLFDQAVFDTANTGTIRSDANTLVPTIAASQDAGITAQLFNSASFDLERPWGRNDFNEARNFVIMAGESKLYAMDLSFGFDNQDIVSFIERRRLHLAPSKDVESLRAFFIETEGDDGETFRIPVETTNNPSEIVTTLATPQDRDYSFLVAGTDAEGNDADYKTDVRRTGRFLNFRIENTGQGNWSIAGISTEVVVGGTR